MIPREEEEQMIQGLARDIAITEITIDAAAKALREHDMKGRITRPWDQLPKSDAKKWREKASIALWAASGAMAE
jgi:hypothetical protein